MSNTKQPDPAVATAGFYDAWAAPATSQLAWSGDCNGAPVEVRVDTTGAGLVVEVDYDGPDGHHHTFRVHGAQVVPTYRPPAHPPGARGHFGRTRPYRQPPPADPTA